MITIALAIKNMGAGMTTIRTFVIATGAVCLAVGAAQAQDATGKVGTLICEGQGTVGLILGSKQSLDCTYKPSKGRTETYVGTITKVGLDVGVTGKSTMIWSVVSSTTKLGPRFLAGNYAGASAGASVGVGGAANLLVGGNKNSVTLQPFSVQGQTGVNLAVGVAGFTLR